MDGTFEVPPLIYKQMYNIAAKISYTLYYLIKVRKYMSNCFNFYQAFLTSSHLQDTTDFELACINAFLKV